MQNFKTLGQTLLGETFVVVVCKPILVFTFDFVQAEQLYFKVFFEKALRNMFSSIVCSESSLCCDCYSDKSNCLVYF